jgi:3-hydroxyisobutyrate dehydrogenase
MRRHSGADASESLRVGWVGAGRMGAAMAARLLEGGAPVTAWNRTRSRLEQLIERGAEPAERLASLRACEVVFSMVADDAALDALAGGEGLLGLADGSDNLRVWVDCSTVSEPASLRAAEAAAAQDIAFVAAPVSGNPAVASAGNLIFAVSGPQEAYDVVAPLLNLIGRRSFYLGPGHTARTVKLCTNMLLAVVTQGLAEAVVLGERAGVPRADLIDFVNASAVGSPFTAYKGKAFVDLDFTPTFTPEGQRKDLRLALEQAARLEVPMYVAATVEVALSRLIASGVGDGRDFGALLLQTANDAGLTLT